MPVNYVLAIDSTLKPDDVLMILLEPLGRRLNPERDPQGFRESSRGPGFDSSAGPVSDGRREILTEQLGITPKVSVRITPDKFGDEVSQQYEAMIRGVVAVLRQVPGDAVLLFEGDRILLLRKEGQLYLNKAWGWDDRDRPWVDIPYELKDIPHL